MASGKHNYRSFAVVFIITALLWFVLEMTDDKDFSATYRVEYVGYDSTRYALLTANDSLSLSVNSNGFQTLVRNRNMRGVVLRIDLANYVSKVDSLELQTISLTQKDIIAAIRSQLDVKKVSVLNEQIAVQLVRRNAKAFVPRLSEVNFEFAEGYALNGAPVMMPDTVYLYGSQASLDKVAELTTRPAAITNINASGEHVLLLDTAWRRFPDLHISAEQVSLFVPVVASTEQHFSIPLTVHCIDSNLHVRLYPQQVEVDFWLPTGDYSRVKANQFEASVTLVPGEHTPDLKVSMDRFPSNVQIRKITPATVSYVVIK
ncbi:MAG: hypothetical protein HUK17_04815 [Bacteroidales bacterium]|nr:hypothetical protein [Bacteroidales bacterium]